VASRIICAGCARRRFKEYSAIKPIFTALAKLYPEIDRGIDRHDYEELTEKLADETKHARLVMDLLEEISGKKNYLQGFYSGCRKTGNSRKFARATRRATRRFYMAREPSAPKKFAAKTRVSSAPPSRSPKAAAGRFNRVCSELKTSGVEGRIAKVFLRHPAR
jgi:hypothetical protein